MQDKRGLLSVAALKDFHLEGNVIPMEWFAHLKFENGKPDMNAILILADIVYWYRPVQFRDEETGMVVEYRKKFKNDLLQKSYHDYANLFGLSKRQVTDAIIRLESRGLIQRVFRVVETPSATIHNVLFIALNVEKVRQLQTSVGGVSFYRGGSHISSGHPPRSIGTPPTIERDTYTKTTTKITPLPPPLTPPPGVGGLDNGEEEDDEEENLAVDKEEKTLATWELAEIWDEEDEDAAITAGMQAEAENEDEEKKAVDMEEEVFAGEESTENEKEEDDKVCQTMISHWNVIVQHKLHGAINVFPSNDRLQKLNDWRTTFGKYIVWEYYCTKIANCRFLMGDSSSGFKVTLEWALNPKNVHKVIEGAIYDKPLPVSDHKVNTVDTPTWDSLKTEMQAQSTEHLPSMPQEPPNITQKWLSEWLKVGEVLSSRLGTTVFKSWFLDVVLVELTPELAVLQVKSVFWKNYLENHYQSDIEWAFTTCYPTLKTVKIQVQENNHA